VDKKNWQDTDADCYYWKEGRNQTESTMLLRIVICNNRLIIWMVNWKGCERNRPFAGCKFCYRMFLTLLIKNELVVDQDIDRPHGIRIRNLPIRAGGAVTTPGRSVFWGGKWIVIEWKTSRSAEDGVECRLVYYENIFFQVLYVILWYWIVKFWNNILTL
jgi:hypothetical protein